MAERHPLALSLLLAGVQLLAVLDGLAAALALPAIGADLGLGAAGRAWVLNATSVSLAGGLLVAGRLGDVWGRRPLFLAGVLLLLVGSAVTAAAPTAEVMFAGRVVIGLGAATAYPSALSLTGTLFPDDPWRTRAFAASAVTGASGALGGAVYGGLVTELLGWRAVFWLTVPVTVVLLVAAWVLLPRHDSRRERRRLDLIGGLLATATMTAGVGGVIGLGTGSVPRAVAGSLVVLGLGGGLLTVWWEQRVDDPLLPGVVVGSPRILTGCSGMAANSALWSAVTFVLAQQLQAAGWSAGRAAIAIVPCSAGIVLGGVLVVPALRRRVGSVRTILLGLLLGSASAGALALVADPRLGVLLVPLLTLGVALSAVVTGSREHALRDDSATGVAAAVFESSTHVGGAVAVSLFAAALATSSFGAGYAVAAGSGLAGAVGVAVLSRRAEPTGRAVRQPPSRRAGGAPATAPSPSPVAPPPLARRDRG